MLYRDEKFKHIVHRELKILWHTTQASKKRTYWLGGLAAIAWIAGVAQLPPPQHTKSIVPHLIMIGIAHGITKSVKDNLEKTTRIQKRTVDLARHLRSARNCDDLSKIYHEINHLENQFVFKSYHTKD